MIPIAPAALGVPHRGGRRLIADPGLDPLVALSRTQTATRATAIGADDLTWSEFAADAVRFQGSARRLLIEGTRSNRIRNPRAEGAVAGTPGTLPTNWAISGLPSGVASSVVGIVTTNGVQGLRIRVSGTPASTTTARLDLETLTSITAANGQTWTGSAFVRLQAGSPANLGLSLRVMGRDNVQAAFNMVATAITLGGSLARSAATTTIATATVVTATLDLQLSFTLNQAVDCTFDIGWPQMEQASFASSPILPVAGTPAVSTRSADLLTATLPSLGIGANGACTVLAWALLPQASPSSVDQNLVSIDDGTTNNRYRIFNVAGGSAVNVGRSTGGTGLTSLAGTMTAGTAFKAGMSVDGAGRVAGSVNGAAAVAQTGGPTAGLTTLRIGNNAGNTGPLCGVIPECRVLPFAVSDATLAGLVASLPG
ncbi:phage head spike fiber domain-containing protein [Falsiroseomonas sp. HW251]|uniref:phage head spike fiber domain-containing protein n=1 Tax=Falsiroseomonas sp. HW251 TaxID=3390998 RepID=UPI003D320824